MPEKGALLYINYILIFFNGRKKRIFNLKNLVEYRKGKTP